MFPNLRLLIAAMVASVVALSCGFAVFAAFRVNHEPLAQLAPTASPLQFSVGSAALVSTTVAAMAPFDRGFQANETGPGDAVQPAAALAFAPESTGARIEATAAAMLLAQPMQPPALATARPAPAAMAPITGERGPAAARPESAAAGGATAPVASLQEQARDPTPEAAAATAGDRPPAAVANITAATPAPNHTPPADPVTRETEPTSPSDANRAADSAPQAPAKAAAKTKARKRLAAKTRRPHRRNTIAFAQSNAGNFMSVPPNLQPAPQPLEARAQRMRVRRSTVSSGTDQAGVGVGGPFFPRGQ